jgi:hypothetical protein
MATAALLEDLPRIDTRSRANFYAAVPVRRDTALLVALFIAYESGDASYAALFLFRPGRYEWRANPSCKSET